MQSFIIHIILIIFYCIVFCLAITKLRWFRESGIRPSALLLFFGLRVAAGWLHNLVAHQYFPGRGDIWIFFSESFIARWELFHDFRLFLTDNFIWAYMPHNTIVLIHVLFNFLSFDNLYINTLFFSFFVFWGSIALFRCIYSIYRDNLVCAVIVLILPSTLFWTACIYTEGLLYFALGFFYFHLHRLLAGGWNNKQGALCIFFGGMVLFFRPNVFATLASAAVLWILAEFSLSRYGPSGGRPSGDRLSGDRLSGDRLSGDRHSGTRLSGEKLSGDRLSGDSPSGDRLSGDRLSGDRLSGDRLSGDRLSGDRLSGDRLSGDRLSGDRLSGDRLSGENPTGDRLLRKYIIRSSLVLLAGVILLCMIRPALPMKVLEGVLRVASERQKAFQSLTGHSRIWLPVLEPSVGSFLRVLPAAVFNGFLQPLPGSGGKTIYLLFSVELMLIWAIVVFALYRRYILHKGDGKLSMGGSLVNKGGETFDNGGGTPDKSGGTRHEDGGTLHKRGRTRQEGGRTRREGGGDTELAGEQEKGAGSRFGWPSVLFAIWGMLIIGFTVPFVGAIARYRSIYLPFLLIPFIKMLQEWPPVKRSNKWLSDHIMRPL